MKGVFSTWLPISCSQQNNTASSTSKMATKKATSFLPISMAALAPCALKQTSSKAHTITFRTNGNTYRKRLKAESYRDLASTRSSVSDDLPMDCWAYTDTPRPKNTTVCVWRHGSKCPATGRFLPPIWRRVCGCKEGWPRQKRPSHGLLKIEMTRQISGEVHFC